VKFIFPNEHGVYMHDTAKKALFKFPVRAYSHGCMRVHEPLKFAEYLLREDKNFQQKLFDKWLAGGKETTIRLKDPMPIHVEYYTVRVDDTGTVNFLADVYKYDRQRLSGKKLKEKKCEPTVFEDFIITPEEEEGEEGEEGQEGQEGQEGAEGAEGEEGAEEEGGTPSEPEGEGTDEKETDKKKVPALLKPKTVNIGDQPVEVPKVRKIGVPTKTEENPAKGDIGP
jgi:hypothetical protein